MGIHSVGEKCSREAATLIQSVWRYIVKPHEYKVEVVWSGNDGEGTRSYSGYRRDHTISIAGKPVLPGSSDPAFRGDASRYNPEELLVASLSACHML